MVARCGIQRSNEAEGCQADVDSDVTHVPTTPTEAAPDKTVTAVQLKKHSVALRSHCDPFFDAS